eukprot:3313984-Amphidinium_carterae.1
MKSQPPAKQTPMALRDRTGGPAHWLWPYSLLLFQIHTDATHKLRPALHIRIAYGLPSRRTSHSRLLDHLLIGFKLSQRDSLTALIITSAVLSTA